MAFVSPVVVPSALAGCRSWTSEQEVIGVALRVGAVKSWWGAGLSNLIEISSLKLMVNGVFEGAAGLPRRRSPGTADGRVAMLA